MRSLFGKWLLDLARKDKDVVLIVGDNGYTTFLKYQEEFPERYFNVGICEQAMIGMAAGMAMDGCKPYVFTIPSFLLERPFEQIKLDIDAQQVNVKLVGYEAYSEFGITHVTLNSAILTSMFRNIRAYFPKTAQEVVRDLQESYELQVPTFVGLTKL